MAKEQNNEIVIKQLTDDNNQHLARIDLLEERSASALDHLAALQTQFKELQDQR